MARQVALLRGVNVGGINIKMADLARVFRDLGLEDVRTVLASGNVVFEAPRSDSALKKRIEGALRDAFGYDAWVILASAADVARIIEAYPFPEVEAKQPWVMFLAEPEVADDILAVEADLDASVERVQRGDGVIYWEVTKGQTTDSVFGKHTSKARFKPLVTTRNLRTLRKIVD